MQRPPVIDSEILERELALSIVKGAAATKAKKLFVASRRDRTTLYSAWQFGQWNFVTWHETIIAPVIDEKIRALRNRQTPLLIGPWVTDSDGDTP